MEAGLKDNILVGFFGICYMSQENWALKERKAKGIHCKQDTDRYVQHVLSKNFFGGQLASEISYTVHA